MNDWNAEQLKAWEALKIAATKIVFRWSETDGAIMTEVITANPNEDWDTIAELAADKAGLYPSWEYIGGSPILCLNPAGLD